MTNIKQSLLVAICTLVSMSIINAVDTGATASRSIRAGAQGCVRRAVVAQQAQPMSQQLPIRKKPINRPTLEAKTQETLPMSQQIPTMQAPVDEPVVAEAEEPALVAETVAVEEPAVEEVDVLAQPNGSQELPASDNALDKSALDIETSPSDMILEPNASEMSEEPLTEERVL